jgi:hypothetical protein
MAEVYAAIEVQAGDTMMLQSSISVVSREDDEKEVCMIITVRFELTPLRTGA